MKKLLSCPCISDFPFLSIALVEYNQVEKLKIFLDRIQGQTYPKDKLEIIIADGGSTDGSIAYAKEKGCRVLVYENIDVEHRRSIAIQESNGEFVFVCDDDNYFPNPDLLENMVSAFIAENAFGVECAYQHYDKNDYLINRYCALLGVYDPSVYYLDRQDHLSVTCETLRNKGQLICETDNYFKVKFDMDNVPTMGDQGFLVRKNDLFDDSNTPILSHMNFCTQLIKNGKDEFIFMKDFFGHDCVTTKRELLGKLKRNISFFNRDLGTNLRELDYHLTLWTMIKLGLILGTFIIPLKDAVQGYCKLKDPAWFIHPVLCFQVAWIYSTQTLKHYFQRYKKSNGT